MEEVWRVVFIKEEKLSSRKDICIKYEYLKDEKTLPPQQHKMQEETKFTYSGERWKI